MTYDEKNELVKQGLNKVKKYSVIGTSVFAALVVLKASIFNVSAGEFAIEQTPSGNLVAHMTPGYKFKIPFVSTVWFYDEVTTVVYDETEGDYGSSQNKPYPITFADTYGGEVKGSFRVELPKDPDKFIELHKAFKRYNNFIESGAEKFTNELLTYTAMQFTGETFMQGGQNEYKNRLIDQATNGLYVTKRTAVKVNKESGQVGLGNDNASKTSESEAVIYQNIVQRDENGKPKRQENSMAQYGVTVSQVTISGFNPEKDLESFMVNKKEMVRKRAKLVEDQENERQQAITAKLKGDRERVEAKQQMLMEKDSAEIKASKEVELAKIAAERETVDREKLATLAIIDKKKELQIATDNEGIQKANAAAAKYEAQAIKEKGLAQAQVEKAMYEAKIPALYSLEKQVEITKNLKDAFRGINVTMPTNMITNGSGSTGTTSVDQVMQLLQLDKLDQISKATK